MKFQKLTIIMIIPLLIGCSASKYYEVKLTKTARKNLSLISVSIENKIDPLASSYYMTTETDWSGTTSRPLGSSSDWSAEEHKKAFDKNENSVKRALERYSPNDSEIWEIFSNINTGTNLVSFYSDDNLSKGLNEENKAVNLNISLDETNMHIKVYHVIKIGTSGLYRAKTYMGVRMTLEKSGVTIYDRKVFSENELISTSFLNDEYHSFIVDNLQKAFRTFRDDIAN